MSVLRLVSQPLPTLPSQSPKPALQASAHAPRRTGRGAVRAGAGVAAARRSWSTLVLVLVSQPSRRGRCSRRTARCTREIAALRADAGRRAVGGRAGGAARAAVARRCWWSSSRSRWPTLPSQFAEAGGAGDRAQARRSTPRVPLRALQALPQRRSCAAFVSVLVSQPLAGLPSQLAKRRGARRDAGTTPVEHDVAGVRQAQAVAAVAAVGVGREVGLAAVGVLAVAVGEARVAASRACSAGSCSAAAPLRDRAGLAARAAVVALVVEVGLAAVRRRCRRSRRARPTQVEMPHAPEHAVGRAARGASRRGRRCRSC